MKLKIKVILTEQEGKEAMLYLTKMKEGNPLTPGDIARIVDKLKEVIELERED